MTRTPTLKCNDCGQVRTEECSDTFCTFPSSSDWQKEALKLAVSLAEYEKTK